MNKPKPYTLTFRMRSPKHTLSTYQDVNMLLRVGTDRKLSVITGYRLEREVWYSARKQTGKSRNYVHAAAIEARLDAIRYQIDQIYRYQVKKSQIEGWRMTSRTVLRQFQGLLPYEPIRPITPCQMQWQVIQGYPFTLKTNVHHA